MNINIILDSRQTSVMRGLLQIKLYDIISSGKLLKLIGSSLIDGEIRLARNKAELESVAAIMKQIEPGFNLVRFITSINDRCNFSARNEGRRFSDGNG